MLDTSQGRCSGAAIIATDEYHISMGFRDAGGNGSYSNLSHELNADARSGIRIFQIMDQLGEVFDGIDIVMRRRRDKATAGRRVTSFRNRRKNFVARKSGSFQGFW